MEGVIQRMTKCPICDSERVIPSYAANEGGFTHKDRLLKITCLECNNTTGFYPGIDENMYIRKEIEEWKEIFANGTQ